ncbi:MAG: ATP-dependent sacrificial sulfur transferase LarE [Deltaproteobacteria bacterium]|nr:ATP-dependent sacrificial sulfur transferase LarE [Deltaproteobacteria bacterium]
MESLQNLEQFILGLGQVVVGLSGGVDSCLLAFVARKMVGRDNVLAVTGDSASVPSRDREFVVKFCEEHDIPHQFMLTYEHNNPNYQSNPSNRCFFCKEELYQRLNEIAHARGWKNVLDGTNVSDLSGHRPGFEALKKAGVIAPYVELGIDKNRVRNIAKHFNLEVADKAQSACLASRIPTGTPIDLEALQKVDRAENLLRDLGILNPRVRFHGDLARLELKPEEWENCFSKREIIRKELQTLGFKFVTLDLKAYEREG